MPEDRGLLCEQSGHAHALGPALPLDRFPSERLDELLKVLRIVHVIASAGTLLLHVGTVESGNPEVDWVPDLLADLVQSDLVHQYVKQVIHLDTPVEFHSRSPQEHFLGLPHQEGLFPQSGKVLVQVAGSSGTWGDNVSPEGLGNGEVPRVQGYLENVVSLSDYPCSATSRPLHGE